MGQRWITIGMMVAGLGLFGLGQWCSVTPVLDLSDPAPWEMEAANQLRLTATRGMVASPAAELSIADHLEPLGIEPGHVVADIGCGSGFTVPWLSRTVGPTGSVFAVEYFGPTIRYLKHRVDALAMTNVKVHQDRSDDLSLPDDTLDRSFLINVMHVFSTPEHDGITDGGQRFVDSIFQATKPGGRVMVMDAGEVGGAQGAARYIPLAVVQQAYTRAGFAYVMDTKATEELQGMYRVIFERPHG